MDSPREVQTACQSLVDYQTRPSAMHSGWPTRPANRDHAPKCATSPSNARREPRWPSLASCDQSPPALPPAPVVPVSPVPARKWSRYLPGAPAACAMRGAQPCTATRASLSAHEASADKLSAGWSALPSGSRPERDTWHNLKSAREFSPLLACAAPTVCTAHLWLKKQQILYTRMIHTVSRRPRSRVAPLSRDRSLTPALRDMPLRGRRAPTEPARATPPAACVAARPLAPRSRLEHARRRAERPLEV